VLKHAAHGEFFKPAACHNSFPFQILDVHHSLAETTTRLGPGLTDRPRNKRFPVSVTVAGGPYIQCLSQIPSGPSQACRNSAPWATMNDVVLYD
jgi:hypothetical protein